ncbi:glycine zipper 2TM domain-containing protein [Duganella sp. Root1480D1]|uniref:glycine zipper 2TM domain-containing protein n=1 Tax=Duganella sp. Root1480D1 TaxID=1736471 RepID=UPI00070A8A65|nr:hypothetical protein ASD58_12190 [Duganella sp. Root1480D1]
MQNSARTKIHPMMAVAAASVAIVSLVGAASIAGLLPNSHANTMPSEAGAPVATVAAPAAVVAPAPEPAVRKVVVEHRTVTHHAYQPPSQATPGQSQASLQSAPAAPAPAPAPAPQNSALGIGIGAVVGGLIGNQIGGGTGRKLATVVGAVGGGYVGNEIAKRNQQPPQQ